ncbi:LysR family transcriptional regulator [Sphingomonas sp. Root710]|uniref:LysR family transcriptional regulator n=1 Tax=Sphingomonas sp. Root710 TaxID=1736594 RepID=UPI0006FBFE90|nr:LysR family transcriptional regulator [Sphingomonas sp. Root710]KRB85313.1 LysR family transcriptional regulator [Sphingomonas sp. Root710]
MDLRNLRYFVTLATERNFNRAAERLNIAQPPLSRAIQQLEAEVGAELIDRSTRPLRLTAVGRLFLDQAHSVLDRAEAMRSTMASMVASRQRRFVIGFVASTIYARLPQLIRAFRATAPDVELVLVESSTLDQIVALKEGRIDVGFGRIRFDDPEVRRVVLRDEPLIAALPATHPLAQQEVISLLNLRDERIIIYPREPRPSYADQVISLLRDHAVEPRIAQEARELQTAIGLVAAEEGIAIVPESVRRARTGDVVYRELAETATSPIIMSYKRGVRSPELEIMAAVIAKNYAIWKYQVPEGLISL